MPIIAGPLSARVWRVTETLPPRFDEIFERNLQRHAFRPVQPEKGRLRSMGWVNIRQVLDARLTFKKVLFDRVIALALRVDRIEINQRLFRATLAQEVAKTLREKRSDRLSREQRVAIEDQVRLDLVRAQAPSMAVYEMAWQMERGIVFFASTAEKLNTEFADLFAQTFNISLEPRYPYLRAQGWAKRQRQTRALAEVLPAPFSPDAPAEVIVMGSGDED